MLGAVLGLSNAARLENTYLPPSGAGSAGGGPGLATPFGARPGGGGNGNFLSQALGVQVLQNSSPIVFAFNILICRCPSTF